ncbi:MAG: FKBP-type peptidyl-prolyl cis-trans isomerase [Actinomycetaceae bacterium]|nr:FKBP-type peptidyl-prolyl cis-trans isomerase [Actinomycetaceae bacterium]
MKQSRTSRSKRPSTFIFVIAGMACLVSCVLTVVIASLRTSDEVVNHGDSTDIIVNGDFGAPVIVSMPDNFQEPTALESHTLIEGGGGEIVEGGAVLLRTSSFDSRTGEIISEYGEGTVHLIRADEEGLSDFAPFVIGQKQGTRLLIARPDEIDGKPASEIIVMDLLHLSAFGQSKDPSEYANDIIPSVTLSDQGVPQIQAQGARIGKMSTVTLIEGSGGQIDTEQKIAIQYVVTDGHGTVIDSTWEDGSPVLVNLDELMEGLQEGLENQKVGSRVLVVIPSALAKGDGDRIAVVDILAAENKPGDEKK